MRVLIFPAGPISFASARIRAHWLAKHWPAASVHAEGPVDPGRYDVFIFQKIFWGNAVRDAQGLRSMGKVVAWDLCEPQWWNYPEQHALMAREVDLAVACSANLAALARQELGIPCHFIPDRHDPAFHTAVKTHSDAGPLRFVWFGYSGNRFTLYAVLPYLQRLKAVGKAFELLVIDEHPEVPLTGLPCPVIQRPWRLESFQRDMLESDAALLPPHPDPLGRYKSDNKRSSASWFGLPTVSGVDWEELCAVFSPEYRAEAGRRARETAERRYDIRLSVKEWEEILEGVRARD